MTKAEYIEASGELMGRSIKEWWGATPDTPCPDRVKDRIFLRQGRKCAKTGREFRAGDSLIGDHIKRLKDGGENREKNIQIILERTAHDEKTAEENSEGAKVDRIRQKHFGLRKPRQRMQSRPFQRKAWG